MRSVGSRCAAIAHAAIGSNGEPLSKIRAFSEILDSGIAEAADVACMKFCYIDISRETDVRKLFAAYSDSMTALLSRHPNLTLIHFTVPLTRNEGRLKSLAKLVLGKPLSDKLDNIARNEYNALLVARYQGLEPIFDLAGAESATAEGTRASFTHAGTEYLVLSPRYTDDGSHLNDLGRRAVGAEFLAALGEPAKAHLR